MSWRRNPELVYDRRTRSYNTKQAHQSKTRPTCCMRYTRQGGQGHGLGSLDPEVGPRLSLTLVIKHSEIVRSSVNPVWDQRFVFNCHKASDMLELLVQDEDRFLLGAVKSLILLERCR